MYVIDQRRVIITIIGPNRETKISALTKACCDCKVNSWKTKMDAKTPEIENPDSRQSQHKGKRPRLFQC